MMLQTDTRYDIEDLITDYLTGELDEAGQKALQEWVEASEENAQVFVRWREVWLGSQSIMSRHYDSEAAYHRFIMEHKEVGFQDSYKMKHHKWVSMNRVLRWAAVIVLPLLFMTTASLYFQLQSYFSGEVVVSTIQGQQSTFQLPDGTEVSLMEDSRLSYVTTSFTKGKRDINFQGEAYFRVQADEKHPFTIQTSHEEVRVVGTEFNLKSRVEENFDVLTLDRGKVEFTIRGTQEEIKLEAGDELTYNRQTGNTFRRHRSAEEMRLMASANAGNPTVGPVSLQVMDSLQNGYEMQIVVSQPVQPGAYEIHFNTEDEYIRMRQATSHRRFQDGDGTAQNPYVVSNAQQLCNMKGALTPNKMIYFALSDDIDLKGVEWVPLNNYTDEYRNWISLDGRGHVIRNMTPSMRVLYPSFFGVLCGECRNVGFEDANVNGVSHGAGVLAGYIGHSTYPNTTVVENCFFTGRVSTKGYAGGVGGNVGGRTIMRNCCSAVDVSSIGSYAGGLIGKVHAPLTMEYCYVEGNVAGQYAGGIVGGGQHEAKTTPSRYSEVIACNKSVNGSNWSNAIGGTQQTDSLYNVTFKEGTLVNGKAAPGGTSYSSLHNQARSWPYRWWNEE